MAANARPISRMAWRTLDSDGSPIYRFHTHSQYPHLWMVRLTLVDDVCMIVSHIHTRLPVMKERRKLEQLISRKEAVIATKRQGIDRMQREVELDEASVQGCKEALALLPQHNPHEVSKTAPNELRPGSDVANAQKALRAAGHAMHISEILTAIGKEPTKQNRASLVGSISGYVRKGVFFTKVGPNTFSVLGMESTQQHCNNETALPNNGNCSNVYGLDEKHLALSQSTAG